MKERISARKVAMAVVAGFIALGASSGFMAQEAAAAIWSDTEVQLLYGKNFQEPFNPNDVAKTIVTLQHASGWEYGRNFFFFDALKSDDKDKSAGEIYGEWYSTFSLSKITGSDFKFAFIKDVGLTAGLNYGSKSNGANPTVYLPGITVDFDLPGFAFFNVDILAYMDRGKFNGASNGCNANTYQITPAWKLPFTLGPTKWSFEGFVDFIGSHGDCKAQILTQPQIRLDVGNFMGKPDKLFVGIEYQYWKNKFGIKDLDESFPQLLGVWKF